MDHGEAIQMMAAERYLMDELTPEQRDAFEQHVFECQECALDLRAGAAFIIEAKNQLPELASPHTSTASDQFDRPEPRTSRKRWSFFWQPAFAVPVFAVMLAVIAYQNVTTIPSLRRSAIEPHVLYSNPIHVETRGAAHSVVQADRAEGLALSIEVPQSSTYSSFTFELDDPTAKKVWTHTVTQSNSGAANDGVISLVIPASGLREASYTLSIWATTPQNDRVEIDRRTLDIQFAN